MAEDYYDSNPTPAAAGAPPEGPVEGGPEDDTEGDEEDKGSSCLVRASVLGEGRKPGESVTVKILHVYGDEYEIAPDYGGENSPEEDNAFAAMDKMSVPGNGG